MFCLSLCGLLVDGLAGAHGVGKKNPHGPEGLAGWLNRASGQVETVWDKSLRASAELNGTTWKTTLWYLSLYLGQLDRERNPKDYRDENPTEFGDGL